MSLSPSTIHDGSAFFDTPSRVGCVLFLDQFSRYIGNVEAGWKAAWKEAWKRFLALDKAGTKVGSSSPLRVVGKLLAGFKRPSAWLHSARSLSLEYFPFYVFLYFLVFGTGGVRSGGGRMMGGLNALEWRWEADCTTAPYLLFFGRLCGACLSWCGEIRWVMSLTVLFCGVREVEKVGGGLCCKVYIL